MLTWYCLSTSGQKGYRSTSIVNIRFTVKNQNGNVAVLCHNNYIYVFSLAYSKLYEPIEFSVTVSAQILTYHWHRKIWPGAFWITLTFPVYDLILATASAYTFCVSALTTSQTQLPFVATCLSLRYYFPLPDNSWGVTLVSAYIPQWDRNEWIMHVFGAQTDLWLMAFRSPFGRSQSCGGPSCVFVSMQEA